MEKSKEDDNAGLLRQKVTEKIQERTKILDDLGEDVEFIDVEWDAIFHYKCPNKFNCYLK